MQSYKCNLRKVLIIPNLFAYFSGKIVEAPTAVDEVCEWLLAFQNYSLYTPGWLRERHGPTIL
jgi:hypothetical protein